ncbi:CRP/FNR family cyclic AMP-dependent transcriptional regulator [Bradyrhizobium japonicum]|uniref:Crp/Fnr family transcriptional regulator n=1 Tax=Bradyrhizobium TaxID=374 RepID=UPI0004819CCC|nr:MULTISPECIES: Crp/Fnr family transcriptional regulator [Bradyrhizobium]MBR0878164.1 Crp/Fnr family transcriptional regulator [Bradyrhizobium liaoningense]MBR0944117.1 Crp/Fnr family transcriptional regulator [Bradyrhizobium liaoningense]MBR0997909.1 Crp/Fnr family transcriptional regulator [Bradyrhizobium liaoningense]MBR1028741.1 Crp/Fnr family transcriptional regulator [Bradyrhizobium liaoningense]MBR1064240.1 Crp/Fnr family transcriptional regulator [Bradyrhizobium liaoningense]
MHRANSAIAAGVMLAESDNLVRPLPGLLDGLNRADCNRLRAIGREKALEAGQLVWSQGDTQAGIYLISEGRIRSYYAAPSGREVTLAYWFPGNFVGGPDIFGTGPHMWSSVAAESSLLTFMPGLALRRLALESPAIAVALLDALAFKARCYSAMAQMLGTRSVTERLHSLLIFLSHVYGVKRDGEIVIGMPFTHGDLANLIGSTRQWVTVQLARLQQEGVIRYDRSVISILDLSTLEQEME